MKKLSFGQKFIISLNLILIVLWIAVRWNTDKFTDYSTATHSLGQLTGLIGMTLFALSFVLTTRIKKIENIFNGLDKMYKTHHIIGVISFILLLFHPLLLVLKFIPYNVKQAAIYLSPSSSWAVNYGILALGLLIILIILTFYFNLKYQKWKLSHKFMGIVFIIACFHIFLITTDISRYIALKIYMLFICAIGIISYIYGSFIRKMINKNYQYIIESVEQKKQFTMLVLKPVNKSIEFSAGQFVYLRVRDSNFSKEQHPFTIASAPQDKNLKFVIKSLGDYTSQLNYLKKGMAVEVEGPYGRFNYERCDIKNQIWIAGGVGITPFLSMMEQIGLKGCENMNVDLYYSVREKEDAIYLDKIESIALKTNGKIRIIPYFTSEKGHLDAKKIEEISKSIKDKVIFLCGPLRFSEDIIYGLIRRGVKKENIHVEDFNLK